MVVPTPSDAPTCGHTYEYLCPGPVIATEPETPAPEAWGDVCRHCAKPIVLVRHSGYSEWSHKEATPRCDLVADVARPSDPSPELRERLAIAMFERDGPSHIIDWEF